MICQESTSICPSSSLSVALEKCKRDSPSAPRVRSSLANALMEENKEKLVKEKAAKKEVRSSLSLANKKEQSTNTSSAPVKNGKFVARTNSNNQNATENKKNLYFHDSNNKSLCSHKLSQPIEQQQQNTTQNVERRKNKRNNKSFKRGTPNNNGKCHLEIKQSLPSPPVPPNASTAVSPGSIADLQQFLPSYWTAAKVGNKSESNVMGKVQDVLIEGQ